MTAGVGKHKGIIYYCAENLQLALENMASSMLRYLIRELQQIMKAADAKV